jgi:transmembrane sensor
MNDQPSDNGRDESLSRFVRATSGDAGARERLDMAAWAGGDPARRRELDDWGRLAAEVEALAPHYAGEVRSLTRRRRWPLWAAAACCAMLGLGLLATARRDVAADRGRPETVALWNGTRIHLDAGAAVSVPYAPWNRSARLDRGEALFDVPHDEDNPFVVRAGGAEIRDIGTRFLVAAGDGAVRVAVFEGAVEVAATPDAPAVPLAAGEAARVTADGGTVRAAPVDEATATAWRRGRVVFDATPLSEVAARLSRYGGRRIEVGSPEVAGLRLSGWFDLDNRDQLLRTIELSLPVRVQRSDGTAILLPAPRREATAPQLIPPR